LWEANKNIKPAILIIWYLGGAPAHTYVGGHVLQRAPILAMYYDKLGGACQSAEILICSRVIEAVTRCMLTVFND